MKNRRLPYRRAGHAAAWRMSVMAATAVAMIGAGNCDANPQLPKAAQAHFDHDVTPAQQAARVVEGYLRRLSEKDIDGAMEFLLLPQGDTLAAELRKQCEQISRVLRRCGTRWDIVAQQACGNWAAVTYRQSEGAADRARLQLLLLYNPAADDLDAPESDWFIVRTSTFDDPAIEPLVFGGQEHLRELWRWFEGG